MVRLRKSPMGFIVGALVALMLAAVSARPTARPVHRRATAPSSDPFYQPPAGFASKEPGTILRQRNVTVGFLGLIPDPVEAYQLLYRTTAVNGTAIATVTTVFKPQNAKTDRFISYHTAYDSSSTSCDPSYTYQIGGSQSDVVSSLELLIIQAYLTLGYIVASPDYEGPDAAFSPGHLEGMGVLDGMRAVNNFQETLGLSSASPMIVGTGYSGGAIATGWAASLQPSYAPELDIKGWVQGGTPANLTGTLVFIDDTAFSGFLPPALVGLSAPSAYGAELSALIDGVLTSEGRSVLDYARTHCAVEDILNFAEKSIFSTDVQTMGIDLLYDSTIQSVLQKNVMGVNKTETPTAPVFLYHASQDEVIPYANASALADAWCDNGVSVKFTTFSSGGHATTEVLGLPDAINFVEAAFGGTTAQGCSRNSELISLLNPIALGAELEPILIKLLDALASLGEKDSKVQSNLDTLTDQISWS
ncbi:uncharacterized protein N7459_001399 [Penicillium hispanicum]|uniref:uncharacterized protein n=1 Tax=Penicillium hispanicum TaxID=1080232 RepID=UPI00254005F1|nr:uncharacterized protein N7459_001399 [Penicillium hispanicum]KAJ5595191.1 hypothetical protein N7459_001399 [Penicillium hispanicum]